MAQRPEWWIDLDGRTHVVEIIGIHPFLGSGKAFRCDRHPVVVHGRFPAIRTARFDIADHPAVLRRNNVYQSFRRRFWLALGGSWRRLPTTLLSYAFGGPGVGGGAAAASASDVAMTVWFLFALSVDGVERGTWVATRVGEQDRGWTFVAPGGPLPDGRDDTWDRIAPVSKRR